MLWTKNLETGIPTIDEQHKELFRQIDALLAVSGANKEKQVTEALNFLDRYIVKHFTDEQNMHLQSKYPKAVAHRTYHDNYVTTFRQLKEKYIKEGPTVANNMAVNKSVVGWLKEHILIHDKEFAEFYKKKP
ncbi:MAG: hemerythrin family protein [Synergistaceae bacterium]|jgi:hemerythrin|nr:hemerythrin family protein [Synergistaceae bacterium]